MKLTLILREDEENRMMLSTKADLFPKNPLQDDIE